MRYLTSLVLVCAAMVSHQSHGQIKKQFFVEAGENYSSVALNFHAQTGVCYFKPSFKNSPLNIYSNLDAEDYNHSYSKSVADGVCSIDLDITSAKEGGMGKSISMGFLGNKTKEEDGLWKMYLSQEVEYDLDLKFDISDAFIDLSGINVSSLKINSGSANVILDYNSGVGNTSVMENFEIKVNLGSVKVNKMELTKATSLLAEIGFGDLHVNYAKAPEAPTEIFATVGAGNLIITMPKNGVPVIIKIKDSMFCSADLPKGFRKLKANVFVNTEYSANNKNLQTFNVDLAMGNLVIKQH